MTLYGLLGHLESKRLLDTTFKEVVGINAPKILFTRQADERLDTATSEIGNTVAFVGAGGLADQVLKRAFKTVQAQPGVAAQWSVLGRSAGLFSLIFSLMWAMPFIRNYLTTRRTGTVKFTEVIGAAGLQPAAKQAEVKKNLSDNKRKAGQILGLGLMATVLSAGGGLLAAKRGWSLGPLRHLFREVSLFGRKLDLQRHFLLDKGSFRDFSGLKALLFWGIPAYGGWFHASRDSYERKEQPLKFLAFAASFFGPEVLARKIVSPKLDALAIGKLPLDGGAPQVVELTHASIQKALDYARKLGDQALVGKLERAMKLWVANRGLGLLASIVLLGAMQLVNIQLTARRLAHAETRRQKTLQARPTGMLVHRKSFPQWIKNGNQNGLQNNLPKGGSTESKRAALPQGYAGLNS